VAEGHRPTVCGAFNRVLADSPTAEKPCRAGRVRTRLVSILSVAGDKHQTQKTGTQES
jgi:hypothetical protein